MQFSFDILIIFRILFILFIIFKGYMVFNTFHVALLMRVKLKFFIFNSHTYESKNRWP